MIPVNIIFKKAYIYSIYVTWLSVVFTGFILKIFVHVEVYAYHCLADLKLLYFLLQFPCFTN